MRGQTIPKPMGQQLSRRLVTSGTAAMELAARLLPQSAAISLPSKAGKIELRPGIIWQEARMLIYASPTTVYYTEGDRLYECATDLFLLTEWPDTLASAATQIPAVLLGERDTATLQPLFVPWYQSIHLDTAQTALLYRNNRSAIDMLMTCTPIALRLLRECRHRFVKLFDPLQPQTDAGKILAALSPVITNKDSAVFIGEMIKDPAKPPADRLRSLIRILLIAIAFVERLVEVLTILYYAVAFMLALKYLMLILWPPVGAILPAPDYEEEKKKIIREYGEILATELVKEGYNISVDQAAAILEELLNDTGTLLRFRDLVGLLRNLIPLLEQLHMSLHKG